jgi:hypothetical protein
MRKNIYNSGAQTDALLVASLAGTQDLTGTTLAVGSRHTESVTSTAPTARQRYTYEDASGSTTHAQFSPSK